MLGSIKEKYVLDRKIFIYLPPSYETHNKKYPVLYSHDGQDLYANSEKLISDFEVGFKCGKLQEFIWVGIYTHKEQRNHEYTPWPAAALISKFEDFKGLGEQYIEFVVKDLKKYIDSEYNTKYDAANTWVMGYSLGGLISVYSAYITPVFGKIASICGSFWYKDMVKYAEENSILNRNIQLRIHYGKKEGIGKKTIQRNAVLCAEKMIEIFNNKSNYIGQLDVSYDQGGHHQYIEQRYIDSIYWLAGK